MNVNDQIRLDLACACRIIAHEGMDDGIAGHLSVRIPGADELWTTPYPFYFDEVTAEGVVRTDMQGKVLEGRHRPNPSIDIHPAIYRLRPEVGAIVHTHPPYVTAYSALGRVIEVFDQMGAFIFEEQAVYDEFIGTVYSMDAARPIAEALGDKKVGILKNHGLITVGPDLRFALVDTLLAERAAHIQAIATQFGAAKADALSDEVARRTKEMNLQVGHYEDTWRALIRRLRQSDPDLFETEVGRRAALA
jgi:ribulose-5-phosphate 4-epimerase/fuculose-1-phosphate aldolase